MRTADAIRNAKRVYIIGNGGSYANAMHIANDLNTCGVRAHTLDPSTLTAWANDFGYETVFERWIELNGEAGDLLIALTGSGNSKNIVYAIQAAKKLHMNTYAITGAYNPEPAVADVADVILRLGSNMQDAEEQQLWVGHEAMRSLK
jgi:D-sedoheptulose 7-phosphate isomerase